MHTHCKFASLLFALYLFQIANADQLTELEKSTLSPLAIKSLLLQSDNQDSLNVVIGERGYILYSRDNKSWQQALVETKQTLTNVAMHDDKTGWAVGHDAIILKTIDGAKSWKKVFSDITEEAPLLDLYFKDDLNGIAIGAYSLFYITNDGGYTWTKSTLNIKDENKSTDETEDEFSEFMDFHLNDIAYAGEQRFYIAAESGNILRSDDNGKNWVILNSPYEGSFFGVLPLSYNQIIAYGLRGHLYTSSDAGNSWKKIETGTTEMLTDAKILKNKVILVTGLAGTLLASEDNAESFNRIDLEHRHGLTSVIETSDGSIILTSEAGIKSLPVNSLLSVKK